MDRAQARTARAGAFWFVEGEIFHPHLRDRRAAVWAGKGRFRDGTIVCADLRGTGLGVPFSTQGIERGRDVLSAARAGTMPQAGEQDTFKAFGDALNKVTQ